MSRTPKRIALAIVLGSSLALAQAALAAPCTTAYCELKNVLSSEVQAGRLTTDQVRVVVEEVNRIAREGDPVRLVVDADGRLVRSRVPSLLEATLSDAALPRPSLERIVTLTTNHLARPVQK